MVRPFRAEGLPCMLDNVQPLLLILSPELFINITGQSEKLSDIKRSA